MPHSIPDQEKAQADADLAKTSSPVREGWIPGWCLVSEPETLFNETVIPLLVRCGDKPGSLSLDIPGYQETVRWPATDRTECRLTPHGIRLLEERGDEDEVLSVIRYDASTLLVEGEPSVLDRWMDPDSIREASGAHHLVTVGRYALAWHMHRIEQQARLAIVSGTGDQTMLMARARGLVHQSAHRLLNTLLAQHTERTSGRFVVEPRDWLVTRLRPASPTLPFPWLANDEEEPEWRLTALYPALTALMTPYPEIAAGLIGNLLETMHPDGQLPVAGGNASPLFHADVTHPLLIQLILAYFTRHGTWPVPLENHITRLERYLHAFANQESLQPEGLLIWPFEHAAWTRITSDSGLGAPIYEQSTRERIAANDGGTSAWAPLLNARNDDDAPTDAATTCITDTLTGTYGAMDSGKIALITLAMDTWKRWHPRRAFAVYSTVKEAAATAWQAVLQEGGRHPDGVAIAGWCERMAEPIDGSPGKGAVSRWLNHHRRTVSVIAGLLIAGLIGFLLTVQFRTTMPTTVYETQMGLVLQDYQLGRYAAAVEKLTDIERRGHARNPINLMALGKTYFRAKQFDKASATFATLMDVAPNLPVAHFNYGLSLFHAGHIGQAIAVFEAMAEQFARSHPAMASRAAKAAEISRFYQGTIRGKATADGE